MTNSLTDMGRHFRSIYWTRGFQFDLNFAVHAHHFVTFEDPRLNQLIRWATLQDETINVDEEFMLPGNALAYEEPTTIQVWLERHPPTPAVNAATSSSYMILNQYVTLRQLCLEILSEMSNYEVYRHWIRKQASAFHRTLQQLDTCKSDGVTDPKPRFEERRSFIMERLINLMANICHHLTADDTWIEWTKTQTLHIIRQTIHRSHLHLLFKQNQTDAVHSLLHTCLRFLAILYSNLPKSKRFILVKMSQMQFSEVCEDILLSRRVYGFGQVVAPLNSGLVQLLDYLLVTIRNRCHNCIDFEDDENFGDDGDDDDDDDGDAEEEEGEWN